MAQEEDKKQLFEKIIQEARELIDKIEDPNRRAFLATDIAGITHKTEDIEKAIEKYREMEDSYWKNLEKKSIVEVLAKLGDLERAREFANSFSKPDWRSESLIDIARVTSDPKDFEQAEQSIKEVKNSVARNRCLIALISILARAGNIERAKVLANEIEDINHKDKDTNSWSEAMRTIVSALVDAKDLKQAGELVSEIKSPYQKTQALLSIASALAKDNRSAK